MSIFGINFSRNKAKKAESGKAVVKEKVASNDDVSKTPEVEEDGSRLPEKARGSKANLDDITFEEAEDVAKIHEGGEILVDGEDGTDVIDLSDLGDSSVGDYRDSCDDQLDPHAFEITGTISMRENTVSDVSKNKNEINKDVIDGWLVNALHEEIVAEEDELESRHNDAPYQSITNENTVSPNVIDAADYIHSLSDAQLVASCPSNDIAEHNFLAVYAQSDSNIQSVFNDREFYQEKLDDVLAQLQRLKKIFNTTPYPPTELIHHHLERLSGAMPFESLGAPHSKDKMDRVVQNQLLMVESAQQKEESFREMQREVREAKPFIDRLKYSEASLSSEIIGLRFEKQLLDSTITTLAKKFAQHDDVHINLSIHLDKDKPKHAHLLKALDVLKDSSDEAMFSMDSWWMMLVSKEIMSLTAPDKAHHQMKHTPWYASVKGVGDTFSEMIEEIILNEFPDSKTAFSLSVVHAIREQLCKLAMIDEHYTESISNDVLGLHRIWKRFLGQLYLSSIGK